MADFAYARLRPKSGARAGIPELPRAIGGPSCVPIGEITLEKKSTG